ncbi:hypothetical protein M0R45_034433 [Rubus argutus]|uniref:Uncharacterized protein n=1 Tax=Rubus argutus TaxID=59490 RepID=A0AAW1VT27_RUBAR
MRRSKGKKAKKLTTMFEVLRTPDFQKCKAANEIQQQVKLLMDLYKQMTAETLSAPRFNNVPEDHLLSGVKPQVLVYLHGHQNISFHQVYPASSWLKMVKLKGLMLLEDQLLAGTSSPFLAWK